MQYLILTLALVGQTPTSTVAYDVHRPPVTGPIKNAWVRFQSGEWHTGECKRVTNDQIDFDASQSGLDTWDFDDVTDLLLPGVSEFVFEDKMILTGPGRVSTTEVIVHTPEGERRRPRRELLRIVVGVQSELSRWSIDLGINLSANAGNAQNVNLGSNVDFVRRGSVTRISFGYTGSLGAASLDGGGDFETNVFNHRGTSSFDWFFTRRLFWRTYDVYLLHDRFQDISVEVRPSSGVGYQVVDTKKVTVVTLLGGAFQSTNFISDTPSVNTGGLYAVSTVDWDITAGVDAAFRATFFGDLRLEAGDNLTQINSQLDLDMEITSVLDLVVTFAHIYKVAPQGQSPTISPERGVVQNDFALRVGVTFSLR